MSTELPNPDLVPKPVANMINPVDEPRLTFPPFPEAPEGVQIIPFTSFRERGIAMAPGPDDAEVDTLGVPTVPMRTRHKTDECKTNTKRKRRAEDNAARKKQGLGSMKIPWWQQWEDTEAIRFSVGFDRHSSRFDRIHSASADFIQGRSWPIHYQSETGPKVIFEKFLKYIGLPDSGGPPPGEKKKKGAKGQPSAADEMSDDENDEPEADPSDMAGIVLDTKIQVFAKEHVKKVTNEDRLHSFFEDPYKSIKIFLSSHAVEQGFIWYDANLECMGRILGFFVNFLLRSKVLPEIERHLRRSLEVITASITELPNISAMSKKLPDDFSAGCVACWGRKSESYTMVKIDIPEPAVEPIEEAKVEEVVVTEDDIGNGNEAETSQNASGWSATTSWNTQDGIDTWGEAVEIEPTDFDTQPAPEDITQWSIEEKSLLSVLGPTTFPLTHETGIVEQSMRRIKAIILPPTNPPKSPPLPEGVFGPDAEAVENELERLFAKIVLEPMLNWDAGESHVYTQPTILPTSVGNVVGPDTAEALEGGPKAFDPFKDDITLLVENNPHLIPLLKVGMGMSGVWVQLVRQNDGTIVKKKKKGKSKKVIPSYWYMETLSTTVASFWTV